MLPEVLDERPGSESLRSSILSRARLEADSDSPSTDEERPAPPGSSRPLRSPVLRPRLLAAGVIIVIAGLVGWNVALQIAPGDIASIEAVPGQEDLFDAIAAGSSVLRLAGTEAAPEADGALIQSPGAESSLLLVRNLARLSPDSVYQVWHIGARGPVSAGTFPASTSEVQLIKLAVDFSGADAVGVSVEPLGGSESPTADAIVLLGAR